MSELKTIAVGRDIQGWLVRGLEMLRNDPALDANELNATIELVRRAELVTLLVAPWIPE